jgi:2-keto-4-pentenoate hydratase/2-oxohepta-3-ene-1,7-dioic acid hydratase in catechol pathway
MNEGKGDAKEMQRSSTGDQAFSIVQTIVFSSKGTTLVPSDLIFTGTPEGLGTGRTTPLPSFRLQGGDIVKVSLKRVATCANDVEYGKEMAGL